MNAKSSISDWQHSQNRDLAAHLRNQGYRIEVTSQGYQVWHGEQYLGGAGTLKRPHGRYAEANMRDNLQSALATIAQKHPPIAGVREAAKQA